MHQRSLGPYRLTRFLGRGAFARVYAAIRKGDDVCVAIKIILRGDHCPNACRQRLLMEGHMAMGIDHPNVVRYLDVGEVDGTSYVVQELIDGGDGCALLARHAERVPADILARVGRDAAEGLHALHQRGMLHRDIKPANLLLTKDGLCKICDLGLVRPLAGRNGITAAGMVVGTPCYVAPEQIRNDSAIDFRADIYSLAASLYWLATGQTPHQADTLWSMLTRAVAEPFPDPRALRRDLPPALAELIRLAGSKNPADRPDNAAHLADAFDRCLRENCCIGSDITSAKAWQPPTPRTVVQACQGPLVLLVGNDPLIARLCAGRLLVEGWRVRHAADVQTMRTAKDTEAPHAVVIDLGLPDGGGPALVHRLRVNPGFDGIPVIGITRGTGTSTHLAGLTRMVDRETTSPRALILLLQRLLMQPDQRPRQQPAQPVAAILARLRPGPVEGATIKTECLDDLAASAQGLYAIAGSIPCVASAIAQAVEIYARQLSSHPGGSEAQRTLERAVDAMIATFTSPLPGPAWPTPSLLVLEGDPLVRRHVSLALSRVGLSMRAARCASEALRMLAQRPAPLFLADLAMISAPSEFISAVRSLAPIPMLFGLESGAACDRGSLTGIDTLVRPYTAGELLAKIVTGLILGQPEVGGARTAAAKDRMPQ